MPEAWIMLCGTIAVKPLHLLYMQQAYIILDTQQMFGVVWKSYLQIVVQDL